MTEATLVAIITVICGGANSSGDGHGYSTVNSSDIKKERIICYENLVNCAVGPNGKIMTLKEFTEKCSKK